MNLDPQAMLTARYDISKLVRNSVINSKEIHTVNFAKYIQVRYQV